MPDMTIEEQENRIKSYFDELTVILPYIKEAQHEIDRETGGRFNVIDKYVDPKEKTFSRIIADLLDPHGDHGQEKMFLKLFVDEIRNNEKHPNKMPDISDSPSVRTEEPTDKGRSIDIVIDDGPTQIGIENKPWTVDLPGQIDDYRQALEKKATTVCMIYLSGDGQPPSPNSCENPDDPDEPLLILPYRADKAEPSLWRWIILCSEKAHADKIRYFLRDFAEYIADQFNEAKNDEEDKGDQK